MGKEKRTKRQRELEFSKSKTNKNRIMIASAVVVVIIGISIFFATSRGGEEKQSIQNIPNPVVEITPTPEAAPVPIPTSMPQPNPSPAPNPEPKSSESIKATWIEPQLTGDTLSIPISDIEENWNTHFKLGTENGDMNFMAYMVDSKIHVRANICPPCRSIGFSLQKDVLICDRCATTFDARTGEGIEGACVDYPKAAVPYSIIDGNIVMSEADLKASIQDTIIPG